MNKKRWIATLVAVAAVTGAAIVFTRPAAQQRVQAAGAPQVTVARVITRSIRPTEEFIGHVEAVNTARVRPRVGGYIRSMHFQEGDLVQKGEVLFRIDPRSYQAAVNELKAKLAEAEAKLALAESNAERAHRLLPKHAISREGADRANAAAKAARAHVAAVKASLNAAQLKLGFTKVRSPISGRIGKARITPGNLVTSRDVLTTVVTVDPVYVKFDVDEHSYLRLLTSHLLAVNEDGKASLPVFMGLADEARYPHRGHLDFVANNLHADTGTIELRAVFGNPKGLLTPGLFARVKLPVGTREQAVLIDPRAVATDLSSQYVYVLSGGHKVEYRAVTLGPLFHGLRIVKSGLKPGDVIVVNGLQRVRPGAAVDASRVAMDRRLSDRQRAIVRADGAASRRIVYNDPPHDTHH
ncbi:MAG TPA: efflux RND transporter periplasmic adaptor subunit [Gammaproteobacteria bacterium]|nr:efflux RND transporter periplasmic adaptor subunit [Gammaproteobacteria bacterium]